MANDTVKRDDCSMTIRTSLIFAFVPSTALSSSTSRTESKLHYFHGIILIKIRKQMSLYSLRLYQWIFKQSKLLV